MMGCVADTGEVLTVPVSDLTDKSPFTLTSQYPPPEARRIQQQLANEASKLEMLVPTLTVYVLSPELQSSSALKSVQ
jgi:hypothetical protein